MTNSYQLRIHVSTLTAYPRIHSDRSFKVAEYSAVKPFTWSLMKLVCMYPGKGGDLKSLLFCIPQNLNKTPVSAGASPYTP